MTINNKPTLDYASSLAAFLLAILSLVGYFLEFFWLSHWMRFVTALIGIILIGILLSRLLKVYLIKLPNWSKLIIWLLTVCSILIFSFFFTPNLLKSSVSCEITQATDQIEMEKANMDKVLSMQFFDMGLNCPLSCVKTCLEFTNRGNLTRSIINMNLVANITFGKAQNILASDGYVDHTGDTVFNPIITIAPNETIRKVIYFYFPFLPGEDDYARKDSIWPRPQLNSFKIVYQDSVNGKGESTIYGSKEYSLNFKGPGLGQMTCISNLNKPSTPEETQKIIESWIADFKKDPKHFYENIEKKRRLKEDSNSQPQNK